MFSACFGVPLAAQLSVAQKVLSAPIQTIGRALSLVLFERLVRERNRQGSADRLLMETSAYLFILIVPVFVVTSFAIPFAVNFVFGEEWATAGRYVLILMVLYAVKFSVGPCSQVFVTFERQGLAMGWQTALFTTNVAAMAGGFLMKSDIAAVALYSGFGAVCYTLQLVLGIWCAGGTVRQMPHHALMSVRRRLHEQRVVP
jgi:O-antigen/teichoic acid export membrane protein